MGLRTLPLIAVAGAAALVLAGCDSSGTSPGTSSAPQGAQALLLPGGPPGYTLNTSASESLDLDAARVATIADPDTLGTALGRNDYSGGAENVWQQGDRYETDAVFRFRTAAQAAAVLEVEHTAMTNGLGVVADPAQGIPNSWAYTLFGSTRQGGKSVFCQGVWFTVSSDLYGITTCAPTPGDESQALSRGAAQRQRALQGG